MRDGRVDWVSWVAVTVRLGRAGAGLPDPPAATGPRARESCRPPLSLYVSWHERSAPAFLDPVSVAKLGAPADHELLELAADGVVERWLLVALERLAPDLARARGGV